MACDVETKLYSLYFRNSCCSCVKKGRLQVVFTPERTYSTICAPRGYLTLLLSALKDVLAIKPRLLFVSFLTLPSASSLSFHVRLLVALVSFTIFQHISSVLCALCLFCVHYVCFVCIVFDLFALCL